MATTATYLEERISNLSKEPVGNGERAAWSGVTDCSQQSLELGMDSSSFFTLQTGKQKFRGRLEVCYAKLDLRVNCSRSLQEKPHSTQLIQALEQMHQHTDSPCTRCTE